MDGQIDVRVLGELVEYADGAESEVLGVLERAIDRSAGSDELALAIHDWPTRYHFGPERSGILAPIRLDGGDRVLDLGAGAGALSRTIAETGARVVALEGSLERAHAVARRCSGLTNVSVVAGSLREFRDPDGFDVVVAVGVLEYASANAGGAAGAQKFLERVHALLRDEGVLLLAIENQLGLRYLLGAPEDHLGQAYVGVEGYPDENGPRTYSRRELHRMLAEAGFPHQWWAAPFPDYKLPSAILSQAAYSLPDSRALVDQFVPQIVSKSPFPISAPAAPGAVHRTLLQAGLGLEVANSFLVVAAKIRGALARVDDSALAWRFDSGRRQRWCRTTSIHETGAGRSIRRRRTFNGEPPADRWLTQRCPAEEPMHAGRSLEEMVLEACRIGDLDAVDECLDRWRGFLRKHTTLQTGGQALSPFAPGADEAALPGRFLDVSLGNFVDADGGLVYVDDEWQAAGHTSFDLVALRALWYLARRILSSCATHPWSPRESIASLTGVLATRCGVPGDSAALDRLATAECELLAIVTLLDPDRLAKQFAAEGTYTAADLRRVDELSLSTLREDLRALREQLDSSDDELHAMSVRAHQLDQELQRILGRFPMRAYLQLKRRLARHR
ncbi:MAG TPA: methyltransferase [Actinomycetota bacterium]|nr:methyltransferase [Actinomycetota bacterium]